MVRWRDDGTDGGAIAKNTFWWSVFPDNGTAWYSWKVSLQFQPHCKFSRRCDSVLITPPKFDSPSSRYHLRSDLVQRVVIRCGLRLY